MIRTVSPIRNRHLVREIDRGRVRELLVVVMLAGFLLVPLLVYVWNHMEWIRVGYELERLQRERVAQAELGERLRIEKATLSSLARVEAQAGPRLGLAPAGVVLRPVGEAEQAGTGVPRTGARGVQTGSISLFEPPSGGEPSTNGDHATDPDAVRR
jgi:cell division protein FtsL